MMFFFLDGFILIGYRLTRSHLGRRAHLSVRSCLVVGAVVAPAPTPTIRREQQCVNGEENQCQTNI